MQSLCRLENVHNEMTKDVYNVGCEVWVWLGYVRYGYWYGYGLDMFGIGGSPE